MPKFCSKCGHQVINPMTDTFCANCGVSLKKYVVGVKEREADHPPKFKKCDCPCCNPEANRHLRSQSLAPPMSPKTPISERSRTVSDANVTRHIANSRLQKDTKTGWLDKQSNDLLGQWKKRYFKLTFGILFHFTNPDDRKANGSIPLKNTNIEILKELSKPHAFRLTTSSSKSFLLSASSADEMNDWIEAMLEYESVMYDPKIHGWRSVVVESVDNVSQTVPLHPQSPITTARLNANPDLTVKRSNSVSAVAGKISSPFAFLRKKVTPKDSSKSVVKSSSSSDIPRYIENISGPVLVNKPNPITITILSPLEGKQETVSHEQESALRELLFSPSPRAKVIKKGNSQSACDTCGYEADAFLKFCGHCGSKLMSGQKRTIAV